MTQKPLLAAYLAAADFEHAFRALLLQHAQHLFPNISIVITLTVYAMANGVKTPADLKRWRACTGANANYSCMQSVKAGFITMCDNPDDARSKRLILTEQGHLLADHLRGVTDKQFTMLEKFTPAMAHLPDITKLLREMVDYKMPMEWR